MSSCQGTVLSIECSIIWHIHYQYIKGNMKINQGVPSVKCRQWREQLLITRRWVSVLRPKRLFSVFQPGRHGCSRHQCEHSGWVVGGHQDGSVQGELLQLWIRQPGVHPLHQHQVQAETFTPPSVKETSNTYNSIVLANWLRWVWPWQVTRRRSYPACRTFIPRGRMCEYNTHKHSCQSQHGCPRRRFPDWNGVVVASRTSADSKTHWDGENTDAWLPHLHLFPPLFLDGHHQLPHSEPWRHRHRHGAKGRWGGGIPKNQENT